MIPDSFWNRMKNVQNIHRRLYASGKGWIVGKFILLLTHTGRKSGTRYVTLLQYEKVDGAYCVGAGRGPKADWFRNLLADPVSTSRWTAVSSIAWPNRSPTRSGWLIFWNIV